MDSKQKLTKIKDRGLFTYNLTIEQYASDVCKRFARIHGEFIKHDDYDQIIKKLEDHGYLEDEPTTSLV